MIPVPATYLAATLVGAVVGVAAQLVLGWPWWLVAAAVVAGVWLFFASTAFWGAGGPSQPLATDLLRVVRPHKAIERDLRQEVERFRAAPFSLYGLPPPWTGSRHLGGWEGSWARGQRPVTTALSLGHGDPLAEEGPQLRVEVRVEQVETEQVMTARVGSRRDLAEELWLQATPPARTHAERFDQLAAVRRRPDPAWSQVVIPVDGRPVGFWWLAEGRHWVARAELDHRTLTLYARDLPARQKARLAQLKSDLRRFVARVSTLGDAVHAVAGGPDWTDTAHRYLGPKLVQLIGDYNATVAANERLQGVQLDIEPYVDPSFFDHVETSLQDYLSTLKGIVDRYRQVRTQAGNGGLRLGFAIPFWFDGTPEAPPVRFGLDDKSQPAAFHLIDMLRDLPDAYVLVMAYRNFAVGPDGSIEHVRSEFGYARDSQAACGIVVGQEFGKVYPEKLSFWWAGRAAFRQAAEDLAREYGGYAQFRGLSVIEGVRDAWSSGDAVQPAARHTSAPAARKRSRTRYSSPRQRRSAQALARCPIACSTRARSPPACG